MYRYQLINNHYVVSIDGSLYFIDTGCPNSFSTKGGIEIDGKHYIASSLSNDQLAFTRQLVGAKVDGLIGMDILSRTSLTIYKDGRLEFGSINAEGRVIELAYPRLWPLGIKCTLSNGKEAVAIIDTGAMIYYGKYPDCFKKENFVGEFEDYNPVLGKMKSRFYSQTLTVANRRVTVPVGDSMAASNQALRFPNAAIVMNVTELFDETVVFDFSSKRIIFN